MQHSIKSSTGQKMLRCCLTVFWPVDPFCEDPCSAEHAKHPQTTLDTSADRVIIAIKLIVEC